MYMHRARTGNDAQFSTALGHNANAMGPNAIVLSALSAGVTTNDPGFYVKPIRDNGGAANLRYDPTTGEITYDSSKRRLEEEQDAVTTRVAELERSHVEAQARIAALEAQIKALLEKAPTA